jgi:phosphoribosylformimino-5-aminoimidazole carboxamide ribotide isomerase
MRIIPVIDLLGRRVVRGVGGRRDEYQPIVSRLTASAEPLAVARAFRDTFGLDEIYLADLDAIRGTPPACPLYSDLTRDGFRLWVDAGLYRAADAECLTAAGVERVVAGLETLAGPEELERLVAREEAGRVVFSLDLKEGRPLGDAATWGTLEPHAIARTAIAAGARSLLVLDLARVGTGAGPGTEEVCRRVLAESPDTELSVGGGIRDGADLERVRGWGVRAVLVASALHHGAIRPEDIKKLS